MATQDKLFFSRDTKLFIELFDPATGAVDTDGTKWEVPILDGFSFSQSTNTSEVTLSEASLGGVSRRGRRVFTDNFAPAEFSFSTYVRPIVSVNGATGGWEGSGSDNQHHAIEEVLWAMFTGDSTFAKTNGATESQWSDSIEHSTSNMVIDFSASNKAQLNKANLYFVMGSDKTPVQYTASTSGTSATLDISGGSTSGIAVGDVIRYAAEDTNNPITVTAVNGNTTVTLSQSVNISSTTVTFTQAQVYKLTGAVLNECSIDFDLEGIATLNWSGMAETISEEAIAPTATIYEGITGTSSFIRNKISTLSLTSGSNATPASQAYSVTLTGGNITMTNNISFLTPEEIGTVNKAIGHVTGTRSITGSFTCYLNTAGNGSADLFEDLMSATSVVTHEFNTTVNVGGTTGPCVAFAMPQCHVSLPAINIEDVVSVEVTFDALPSSIPNTDELTITYKGA